MQNLNQKIKYQLNQIDNVFFALKKWQFHCLVWHITYIQKNCRSYPLINLRKRLSKITNYLNFKDNFKWRSYCELDVVANF